MLKYIWHSEDHHKQLGWIALRLVYINKEECQAHIKKRMGTGLRTIVKNYKGMFCWSNFFSQLHVLKFSNKLILLEFQMMVVVEVIS